MKRIDQHVQKHFGRHASFRACESMMSIVEQAPGEFAVTMQQTDFSELRGSTG
jgi:hypothetical protein